MSEIDSAAGALLHIVHSRPGTPPNEYDSDKEKREWGPPKERKRKSSNFPETYNGESYSSANEGSGDLERESSGSDRIVKAYAKLQGEDFVYYIRSLTAVLGRKTVPGDDVNVDLGSSKIISRRHARIEYNFESRYFQIECLGKNGLFVDGKFITKDSPAIPLETKTLIQIGERWFYFLLPLNPMHQIKALFEEPKNYNDNNSSVSSNSSNPATTNNIPPNPARTISLAANSLREFLSASPIAANNNNNKRQSSNGSLTPRNSNRTTSLPGSPFATVPNSPVSSRPASPTNDSELPDYKFSSDVKPPFSYASLIAQAINSTNEKKLTLSGIYSFIMENYPYYRAAQNGWQNSIRHNLSLNKAFVKIARSDNEPGKGAFWTIDSQYEHLFSEGIYKRRHRIQPRQGTSTPTSSTPSQSLPQTPKNNQIQSQTQTQSPSSLQFHTHQFHQLQHYQQLQQLQSSSPNLQDGRKQQGDLMGEPDKKKAKSSHNPILSPRFLSTSQMLSPNSRSLDSSHDRSFDSSSSPPHSNS